MNQHRILSAVMIAAVFGAILRAPAAPINAAKESMARGNAAFQADDYAAAYRLYDQVFQVTNAYHPLRVAAYYRREHCVCEIITAIERNLLAGNLERATEYLDQAESFAARGSVERAQLDLLRAKMLHAQSQASAGALNRAKRWFGSGERSPAEDILAGIVAVSDPFTPAMERSEAWYLLYAWAVERGDKRAAAAALQGLRREPAPNPFWVWRADQAGWADYKYGPQSRAEFNSIMAEAGQPRETVTRADGWPARMAATNLTELTASLEQLRRMPETERHGRIVFVPRDCNLDLRGHFLDIPAGVILAGDRGMDGSKGTILRCSHFDRGAACITLHSRSRLTGFRVLGERDAPSLPVVPGADSGSSSTNALSPDAVVAPSADGTGVEMAWDADHGLVDNCEIAWFGRNGVYSHGQYLRVSDCHFHHIKAYCVAPSIYAKHLLVENSRIDWTWQAIGGGRSLIAGYEVRQCVINDARAAEYAGSATNYFCYGGTAMGHHSDLGGLRVHVWGNVFPRADARVLRLRTVSPRNGPNQGALVHNNWFPQPYFAGQPPAVRAELLEYLKRRGSSKNPLLLDYVAGEDYDPLEMEIHLRVNLANLWTWRNFYGGKCEDISVSVWTTPKIQWLMPRVLPPTFRLNNPASIETILKLKAQPGGRTVIPLAWKAQAFPGRLFTGIAVSISGPFEEVLPGIIPRGSFQREIYCEKPAAPMAESVVLANAEAEVPAPGFYRLDLRVSDSTGRTLSYPGFVYCEREISE